MSLLLFLFGGGHTPAQVFLLALTQELLLAHNVGYPTHASLMQGKCPTQCTTMYNSLLIDFLKIEASTGMLGALEPIQLKLTLIVVGLIVQHSDQTLNIQGIIFISWTISFCLGSLNGSFINMFFFDKIKKKLSAARPLSMQMSKKQCYYILGVTKLSRLF